jgi:hypothetical protein
VVKPIAVVALVSLAAFLFACGGDEGGSSRITPAPRVTATAGATASLDPRSGPPGTLLTVSGAGWPAGASVEVRAEALGANGPPFARAEVNAAGVFQVSFRLEALPDGSELQVGVLALRVESGSSLVRLTYLVEVRRPVRSGGPGG